MPEHVDHHRRRLCLAGASLAASQLALATPWPVASGTQLPSFQGATGWINTSPLNADALQGKVVLVNFCTYTCINWLRSLPWVRAWADKYQPQGLTVIGVHTPEFQFEKEPPNVQRALKSLRIGYPIAVDSKQAVWNAFNNQYWPALYLFDASGRMQHQHFGEGGYEQTERMIQKALGKADTELVTPDTQGWGVQADWRSLKSPENYLGYERTENFASPGGGLLNAARSYVMPPSLRCNQWALSGDWTMGTNATVLNRAGGRLACRFHARDLHLVMAPAVDAKPARFRVYLDGQPPGKQGGMDLDQQGMGTVGAPRLYQLIRQQTAIADRQFEIEFSDPGVQLFAFTFG
ncbi:MAG: hypothetical protein JWP36_2622 [Paucimonas sp.]|nr:hypothetical protein [Paucimonas sp.]